MSADQYDEHGDHVYDPGLPEIETNVVPIQCTPPTQPERHDDWAPIDLNDPQWDEPARAPDLHQFLYSGLRHLISGPPEATKTLVAYDAVLRLARERRRTCIIDFEMGARRAKLLLLELGATPADLAQILFIAPETPPSDALETVIAWDPVLVVIDASLGAFLASGLDDNKRQEVEQFAAIWVLPLWRQGIATAVIDHVTKNVEGRASWAIGSERKAGQVDVHIGLSVGDKRALTRGGKATVQADIHKDRPGFLRRPTAFFIDIVSHEETHELTVSYRAPEKMDHTETGDALPTIKMSQISHFLSRQHEPVSQKTILSEVGGNESMAVRGLRHLVALEHVREDIGGPGKANLYTLVMPYDPTAPAPSSTPPPPPPPNLRQTSASGGADTTRGDTSATSAVPLKGAEVAGGGSPVEAGVAEEGGSANFDPAELERLLALYDDEMGDA